MVIDVCLALYNYGTGKVFAFVTQSGKKRHDKHDY